jgi:hypothetical protein
MPFSKGSSKVTAVVPGKGTFDSDTTLAVSGGLSKPQYPQVPVHACTVQAISSTGVGRDSFFLFSLRLNKKNQDAGDTCPNSRLPRIPVH